MKLQKENHWGPSICVKIFDSKWCLAAYGPYIQVYNYQTGELINECQVFTRNKVHGISIHDEHILLYGGRSLALVVIHDLIRKKSITNIEKFIREWIFCAEFSYDALEFYILTSYNTVFIVKMDYSIFSIKAVYGERSILYSGSIKVTKKKVYIGAGTVMGGIIIWDLLEEKKIHKLLGHKGSIFSVVFSSDSRLVASCSDDRSIKLWDIDTGEECSTGWGHTARVWNMKFFENNKKIISVSEDCTCRVWNIHENQLIECRSYDAHLMKNVWGVDVDKNNSFAITSGNDGRIRILDFGAEKHSDGCREFSLDGISNREMKFSKDEIIKGFYWLGFGLVVVTSKGQILKYIDELESWELILIDNRLKDCIVLGIQEINVVVVVSRYSLLMILKFDRNGILGNKIDYTIDKFTNITNFLLTKSECDILVGLELPNNKDPFLILRFEAKNLNLIQSYNFKKPHRFFSTCMAVNDNYVLVGCRFSTLAIFDMNDQDYEYTIKKISPGDSITSISYVENSIFSVTNRDGYYNFIDINFPAKTSKIIHSSRITKGFLEGASFDSNGDYILHGFRFNTFFVYNETQQYEIRSVLCGGAHREWKYLPDGKAQNVLCFVKASKLFIKKFYRFKFPNYLRNGTHGREIRDIAVRQSALASKNEYILATGSEDTTIKFCSLNIESGNIKPFWTQRDHVSGLQRCSFINNKWVISCSAREELFLWEITTTTKNIYVNLKKKLPVSSNCPDLRIMDFSHVFIEGSDDFIIATAYSDSSVKLWHYASSKNSFNLLIDGKYKTCCIFNIALMAIKDNLLLLAAPSDGYLVVWNITGHVPFSINSGRIIDKNLDVVKSKLPNYDNRLRVHQSGTKALEVKANTDHTLNVYTGGDDNALAINNIKIKNTGEIIITCLDFVPKAAASTITSLNLIIDSTAILVTSVDQKIRIWSVKNNLLTLKSDDYTTVADTGSSNVIRLSDTTIALVGGAGLSIWTINH